MGCCSTALHVLLDDPVPQNRNDDPPTRRPRTSSPRCPHAFESPHHIPAPLPDSHPLPSCLPDSPLPSSPPLPPTQHPPHPNPSDDDVHSVPESVSVSVLAPNRPSNPPLLPPPSPLEESSPPPQSRPTSEELRRPLPPLELCLAEILEKLRENSLKSRRRKNFRPFNPRLVSALKELSLYRYRLPILASHQSTKSAKAACCSENRDSRESDSESEKSPSLRNTTATLTSLLRPPAKRQRLNKTIVARRSDHQLFFLNDSLEEIHSKPMKTVNCCCAISNDSLLCFHKLSDYSGSRSDLGEILTLSRNTGGQFSTNTRRIAGSDTRELFPTAPEQMRTCCIAWSTDPCSGIDWYAARTSRRGSPMPIVRLYDDGGERRDQDRLVGSLEVPGDIRWNVNCLLWCPWRPCILGAVKAPNRDTGFLVYDVSSDGGCRSLGFHKINSGSTIYTAYEITTADICEEMKVVVTGTDFSKVKIWDFEEMRSLTWKSVASFRMPTSHTISSCRVVSEEEAIYVLQDDGGISKLDMRQLSRVVWSKKFHCRFPGSQARNTSRSHIQCFGEGMFVSCMNCAEGGSITKWTREGKEIQTKSMENVEQCLYWGEWRLKHFGRSPRVIASRSTSESEEGERSDSGVFCPRLGPKDGSSSEKQARWEFLEKEARDETSPLFSLHYVAGDFHFSLWKWIVPVDVRPSGSEGDVIRLRGADYLWAFTESRHDADELVLPFLKILIDAEGAEASFHKKQILDLFILASGLHLWRRAFFFLSQLREIEDMLLILRFVERLTRVEERCPALEAFYEECLDVLSHLPLSEALRIGNGDGHFVERLQALGIDHQLRIHSDDSPRLLLPPFHDPGLTSSSSSLRETILDDLYSLYHGEEGKRDADVALITRQNDNIPTHLAVLVAKTGFFFRMVRFGGSELTNFRESATIRVCIDTATLKCLSEWSYTEQMTSAEFGTLIDLLCLAEVYFEEELWNFGWKIVVQRSYCLRGSGQIREILAQYHGTRWENLPSRLREFWEQNGMTDENYEGELETEGES